ncbi:sensor domain-containing protein [Salinirubrum litoreum]|uniref:Sensor domain-containing protein n=1 Tax=Salinirubrum litoreum TaxID=1126234 RepID=A0ABD5RDJ4_9EURY|nr:sensor domain-containing protein [Salinirubrum litoreum]
MDNLQHDRTDGGQPARPVLDFLTAPFRVQTYRNLLYLFLQFPLGIAYFVTLVTLGATAFGAVTIFTEAVPTVVGETLGAGAGIVALLIALPVLLLVALALFAVGVVGASLGGVGLFTVDRLVTGLVLGRSLPESPVQGSPLADPVGFARSYFLSAGTYLSVLAVLAKFPVGIAAFVVLTVGTVVPTVFLVAPFIYDDPAAEVRFVLPEGLELSYVDGFYTVDAGIVVQSGEWVVDTLPEALLVAGAGLVLLLVVCNLCNLLAWTLGRATGLVARHASVFAIPDRE